MYIDHSFLQPCWHWGFHDKGDRHYPFPIRASGLVEKTTIKHKGCRDEMYSVPWEGMAGECSRYKVCEAEGHYIAATACNSYGFAFLSAYHFPPPVIQVRLSITMFCSPTTTSWACDPGWPIRTPIPPYPQGWV